MDCPARHSKTEPPAAKRPRRRVGRSVLGIVPRAALMAGVLGLALAGTEPARADYREGIAAFDQGDYETAYALLRPLAEGGDRNAQFTLGFMYDYGRGFPADKPEAVKWYRLAAEQGLTVAQFTLGAIYEAGRGVPLDLIESYRWYSVAAANLAEGETRSTVIKRRDTIAEKLSPAERAEAEARIAGAPSQSADAAPEPAAPEPAEAPEPEPVEAASTEPPTPELPTSEPEPEPESEPAAVAEAPAGEATTAAEQPETEAAASAPGSDSLAESGDADAPSVEQPAAEEPAQQQAAAEPAAPPPPSRALIQAVQIELDRLGYRIWRADGIYGPRTETAIRAFEAEYGQEETGAVTEELLTALQAAEPKPAPEPEPEPEPEPDPAPDPAKTRFLDERIAALGAIARSVDSPVSVDPGWVRLNNWEVETMAILEQRLGRRAAEALRGQAGDAVLGDPLGNFQRTTDSYRRYLESLKARVQ